MAAVENPALDAPRRKGATRIADVPADHRHALSEGRAEAHTLAEWLAADTTTLLIYILPDVGLCLAAVRLLEQAEALEQLGVKGRLQAIGEVIADELEQARDRDAIIERLRAHPSNYAREWLAFAIANRPAALLAERLEEIRPLATDRNLNVRESAWLALRGAIATDIRGAVGLLAPWVHDSDENIRRFAVEGTRPRGVWSAHIPELKGDPAIGLPLLQPVRSDPSDYVRRAAANWLNDASKSQPEWVESVCARWLDESPTAETAWVCNHALRTLRKLRSQ